jgi:hypothetical protein
MALLNFPSNPAPGETYTFGNQTYTWSGSAWLRSSVNNSTAGTITATGSITVGTGNQTVAITSSSITVGSGNQTVAITSSSIYINNSSVLTTATVYSVLSTGTGISINTSTGQVVISSIATLQDVTNNGYTTTNLISILNDSPSISTASGALQVTGGVGIGGDLHIGGDIYTTNLNIADAVFDSTLILVNTVATTVVDSYPISQFRSAKYLIQIDEGMGPAANFQVIEILLLVDNVGTVYATEYGVLTSNGELGEFAAEVGTDNQVKLYFTAYQESNKELVVLRTALAV